MMSKIPPSADSTAMRPRFSWSSDASFSGVTSAVNNRGGAATSSVTMADLCDADEESGGSARSSSRTPAMISLAPRA